MNADKGKTIALLHMEMSNLSRKIMSDVSENFAREMGEGHRFFKNRNHSLLVIAREQKIMPSTLAKYLDLRKSSVTSIIDSLEESGLVCRDSDPDDRRKTWISLTNAGKQYFEMLEEHIGNVTGGILVDLNEQEIDDLLTCLERIVEIERRIAAVDHTLHNPGTRCHAVRSGMEQLIKER
ncbi:MAG: MarR family transcriptional regulator [Methanosarcinaceae archaeon]|nr:MarR family transcriptional regulator [Methanosarcinaceae archaeon]